MWKECATLQKAKDATSVTSQKKKLEVGGLYKQVVRQANKSESKCQKDVIISYDIQCITCSV